MSCLLYVNEEEAAKKISIDDLYERKHRQDLKMVSIFNKILNRIHKRIQFTARNKRVDKYIWFTVPQFIFGEPNYDNGECVGYLVTKLEDNGFYVRYMHPNTLFVSWENWVPAYTRNEVKKRTGVVVDQHGNVIENNSNKDDESNDPTSGLLNTGQNTKSGKEQKQFTPIDQYKPKGNLVYKPELFEKLEKRVNMDSSSSSSSTNGDLFTNTNTNMNTNLKYNPNDRHVHFG